MTTITVVCGNEGSGRTLVATAIATHIVADVGKRAVVVQDHDSERMLDEVTSGRMPLDDVVLVSRSEGREPWMEPWFEAFRGPYFEWTGRRNEP